VAVGLLAACRLGVAFGSTPPDLEPRLTGLLRRLGLPTRPPAGIDPDRLLEAMTGDKKRRGRRAVFVVPAPGGVDLLEGVDPADALAALAGDVPALAGEVP
jgi:3-dehydroquinate synthetase